MSSKTRNQAIVETRAAKRAKREADKREKRRLALGDRAAPVNPALLARANSYGVPDFVTRGYYLDSEFVCKDCGTREVWRATQQKWWYEVVKGHPYANAVRCRSCRKVERARLEAARSASEEGRRKKQIKRGTT